MDSNVASDMVESRVASEIPELVQKDCDERFQEKKHTCTSKVTLNNAHLTYVMAADLLRATSIQKGVV